MRRRRFIKTSIAMGGVTAVGLKPSPLYGRERIAETNFFSGAPTSRVVIAHSNDVRHTDHTFSQAKISQLLDKAIAELFQTSAEKVWSHLFSSSDIVGLKVNCLAGVNLSTRPVVVQAVIERLLLAGVKEQNIIIFDRRNRDLMHAGYEISTQRGKIQCIGNDAAGFSEQVFEFGAAGSQISNVVSRYCSAVINLPILKDHGIVGISCAMKNFFGVINNPNKYHMNIGDPFVADVNMLPPIRQKYRLTICDALTAQYEGGPPFMPNWSWPMNSLLVATDMVAMDQIAWDIIEQKRAENGLPSLEKAGRKPSYIATAADATHRLGTNDRKHIEVVRV
ncbi:DUF362 domain-containing protein [candidate division KSB1 bacterium]|nr:DUF362 domain-containing protein [candidate division KSB1 bacterium]RQW07138.1 MAG: DUF362 domain-containing protein [candidate division KSB1 bacterium]